MPASETDSEELARSSTSDEDRGEQQPSATHAFTTVARERQVLIKKVDASLRKLAASDTLAKASDAARQDLEQLTSQIAELEEQQQQGDGDPGPSTRDPALHNRLQRMIRSKNELASLTAKLHERQLVFIYLSPTGQLTSFITPGIANNVETAFLFDALHTAVEALSLTQQAQQCAQVHNADYLSRDVSRVSASVKPDQPKGQARKLFSGWFADVFPQHESLRRCNVSNKEDAAKCAASQCPGTCAEGRAALDWPALVPFVPQRWITVDHYALLYRHYAAHPEHGQRLINACPRPLAENFRCA